MSEPPHGLPRLSTGIPGFDSLIEGGLPVGGVFLIQGEPGAGKTILANQMCFHHGRTGGQAVYVTLIAETHVRMFSHLRRFEFFDPTQIGRCVHYHAGFRILQEQGPSGLVDLTRSAVLERHATLIVIDGLINAGEVSASTTEFKLLLHAIQTLSTTLGATVVLLSSAKANGADLPEHTVVDGIIQLTREVSSLRARRHIEVRKMRGVDAVTGCHSVEITERGMLVRPRLESRLLAGGSGVETATSDARLPFGLPALDAMLHGGIPVGSNTVLAGPTGTGKTILGLHFLAGGLARGERGLYWGFYERTDAILAKCARIGLNFAEPIAEGMLDLMWERPVEGILDAVTDRLLERLQTNGIKRLCIDGLHALKRTVDRPDRIHAATAALSEELERRGITTVATLETNELFGVPSVLPLQDISAVSQNLLLLRHVEEDAQLKRRISIVKMRDSDYDAHIHDFRITDHGIEIGGVDHGQRAAKPSKRFNARKATRR